MMLQGPLALVSLALSLTVPAVAQDASNFTNPIIYGDYPDNDVSVGPDGAFYFSASSFHFSPAAPILKSWDLVNWEPVGHSIPRLDFGNEYDLPSTGGRAYRGGIWASSLRYRESNKTWYWVGCTNFWNSWMFTAPSPEGPWVRAAYYGQQNCFYDNGLLFDDNDVPFVVFGNPNVKVTQLSQDGLTQIRTQDVFNASMVGADSMEGSRMYQINGTYYVLNVKPGGITYIWKSQSPWGPYEVRELVRDIPSPVEAGSSPHQGSFIQTPNGDWYFMSFTWAYPSGRLPVLAPIVWGEDGFPVFVKGNNGGWGNDYPSPLPAKPAKPLQGTYTFEGPEIPVTMEWNHNPDTTKFSVSNGLTLQTASNTTDLYQARNTITHRVFGEYPVGTVELEFTDLADGDRAGLAAFRDRSAYIGIHRDGEEYSIVAAHNMTIDEYSGATLDAGYVSAKTSLPEGVRKIWLRTSMDARASGSRDADFHYSLDGTNFVKLGETYELYNGWAFFLGYRFGIFNFATKALGGSITVKSFTAA